MIRCCRHIMSDGARCQSPALVGQPFCYQHDRLHHTSRTKPGRKNQLILRPLEDRRTVLMALSEVICALAAGKIDPNTAGRLIYGLQVASQVASDFPLLDSGGRPVESVDFTETGDEMAPAILLCTDDDRCESCSHATTCELKKAVKYRAKHGIVSEDRQKDEREEDDENEIEEDDEESDNENEADDHDNGADGEEEEEQLDNDDEDDDDQDDDDEDDDDEDDGEDDEENDSVRRPAA